MKLYQIKIALTRKELAVLKKALRDANNSIADDLHELIKYQERIQNEKPTNQNESTIN